MRHFAHSIRARQEPLAYVVNEGLIERKFFVPNCAGVLLYSDNPPAVFPRRCGVKIVFYDTKLEEPEREHLKINETLFGPLYQLIHNAADRVTEIMSGIKIVTSDG